MSPADNPANANQNGNSQAKAPTPNTRPGSSNVGVQTPSPAPRPSVGTGFGVQTPPSAPRPSVGTNVGVQAPSPNTRLTNSANVHAPIPNTRPTPQAPSPNATHPQATATTGATLPDDVAQAVIDKLIVEISKYEDICLVFWCLHCIYKKHSINIRDVEREARLYMILKDKKILELVPDQAKTLRITRLGLRLLQVMAKRPEINIFSMYLPREVKILEFISKPGNIEHIRTGALLEVHEEEEMKRYLLEVQGKQYYRGHVNDSNSAFSISPNFGISEHGKEYLAYIKTKLRNMEELGGGHHKEDSLPAKPVASVRTITAEELKRRQEEKLSAFASELINTIKGGDDVAFIFAVKKAMQYIGEEPNSIELTKNLMKDIFEL